MTNDELEQMIRAHPTTNERFLLGLLDEARGKITRVELQARIYALGGHPSVANTFRTALAGEES